MLLNEFRIAHSTLIEHYQYIEAHLEGIYAAISGKSLREGLRDVERDSLSGVVREIRGMEKDKRIKAFDAGEYAQLDKIIERRNFWCHSCYYDMVFDRETGGPAKITDVQKLYEDLKTAEQLREQLFHKKMGLLEKKKHI